MSSLRGFFASALFFAAGAASGAAAAGAAGLPPLAGFGPVDGMGADPVPYRVGRAIVALAGPAEDRQLYRVYPQSLAIAPIALPRPQVVAAGRDLLYLRAEDSGRLAALDHNGAFVFTGAARVGEGAAAADGRLYFTDRGDGQKLWESDGSAGGDRVLFDLHPGWDSCRDNGCRELPRQILAGASQIYFIAEGASAGSEALWAYPRGGGAPRRLAPAGPDSVLWPAPAGQVALVVPDDQPGHSNLVISDGTPAGTRRIVGLYPGYEFGRIAAAGRRLFYTILHQGGSQLWAADFGPNGLQEMHSGYREPMRELVASGDRVYFSFDLRPAAGVELGWSDGNPSTPSHVVDLAPGPASSWPSHFFVLDDGRMVFSATGADGSGEEPWLGDGQAAGSYRLADVAPGAASSAPSHFAQAGQWLFFQADGGGGEGRRLFALDLAADNRCPREQLCLHRGRFAVRVEAEGENGLSFVGRRALAGEESGVFSFFSDENWEMQVKVLDGCDLSGHFWVYASAATDVRYRLSVHDRWSGETRSYTSSGASRPILDSGAFATCRAAPVSAALPRPDPPAPAARLCVFDPFSLCLGPFGRYRVKLDFRTAAGEGRATPLEWGSADAGLFTFFSPGNWEALVKVLDGCAINGKVWVFAAGTTDVGWTLEVEDRDTGERRSYQNELGQPSRTVADIAAFACH